MKKIFDASDPEQNRYLTEGCCPNRCGPLTRVDEKLAACERCKGKWGSPRVAIIWPRSSKETA